MKRLRLQIFFPALPVALVLLALWPPFSCSGENAYKIYRENNPAVVVVVAINGEGRPANLGSGFIVRGDGALVTNYHVINMASEIKIKMGAKVLDAVGLLHIDVENDLAIIKLPDGTYPQVRMGDSDKLQVGEKLYVIGSPQGLENTISEGILSGLRRIDQKRTILQMTAAISQGSSGGPVFNSQGEVVGIATFLIAETQNLNFALPINHAKAGLSKTATVGPREACRLDYSKTAECHFYQGVAYGAMGNHESAADSFRRSLEVDPRKAETHVNLGVSYAHLGRYQEALESFRQAAKLDPGLPDAHMKLGAVYAQMGRYDEALASFSKAIALKPDSAQTFYNLGVTYGKMKDYPKAVEALRESIRLAPDLAEAHGYLGIVYLSLGMPSEAISSFKSAVRHSPDDPRMHLGLGNAYLAAGERASALEEYKILRKLDPTIADELFSSIYR